MCVQNLTARLISLCKNIYLHTLYVCAQTSTSTSCIFVVCRSQPRLLIAVCDFLNNLCSVCHRCLLNGSTLLSKHIAADCPQPARSETCEYIRRRNRQILRKRNVNMGMNRLWGQPEETSKPARSGFRQCLHRKWYFEE